MNKLLYILFCIVVCFGLTSCKSKEEKLVDNPSKEYVIQCLQKVPLITEIEAVSEDNDPNGQLNKPGGYTSTVYFAYSLVNQEDVYGNDLIDKGTDAGGSVEVYANKKDANKRNSYLASFVGSVLSSGSHTVVGTCIVRTSDELTASQQKTLESNIIFALQGQDGSIVTPKFPESNSNNDNSNIAPTPPENNSENEYNFYGTFFMDGYSNSHITIFADNTLFIHDYNNEFNLQNYDEAISYEYISANNIDYENIYPMFFFFFCVLFFEFIHIIDDFTIMYNGVYFSR